jgi:hypothetical protein
MVPVMRFGGNVDVEESIKAGGRGETVETAKDGRKDCRRRKMSAASRDAR